MPQTHELTVNVRSRQRPTRDSRHLMFILAHTPAGGRVEVQLEAGESGWVTIRVRNEGDTIASEHLPRLFDRFYRVDPARERATGGAGLGLAITKSIVTAHGGTIAAASGSGVTVFE